MVTCPVPERPVVTRHQQGVNRKSGTVLEPATRPVRGMLVAPGRRWKRAGEWALERHMALALQALRVYLTSPPGSHNIEAWYDDR